MGRRIIWADRVDGGGERLRGYAGSAWKGRRGWQPVVRDALFHSEVDSVAPY